MRIGTACVFGLIILLLTTSLSAGDLKVKNFKRPTDATASDGRPRPHRNEPDLRDGFFQGFGEIMRITNTEVVIDDHYYRLLSPVAYHHEDGSTATSAMFTVGTKAWFVLQDERGNLIKALYRKDD